MPPVAARTLPPQPQKTPVVVLPTPGRAAPGLAARPVDTTYGGANDGRLEELLTAAIDTLLEQLANLAMRKVQIREQLELVLNFRDQVIAANMPQNTVPATLPPPTFP